MYIEDSEISCGVKLLSEVGKAPTMSDFKFAMRDYGRRRWGDSIGCFLIASVPIAWKKSIKFLKRAGFRQSCRAMRNPNSGNKIAVFTRTISKNEREKYGYYDEDQY